MPPSVPELLVGPLLRYADATTATVWVETTGPAEVEVLGRRTATFAVAGHHFGLLVLDGLAPGTDVPYAVLLDGAQAWPRADDRRPPPRLRTRGDAAPLDVAFGSCRADRPHESPYTRQPDEDERGVGVDALHALSLACQRGERPLPDLLLMLGDQVYADEGLAPVIRERQIARRGPDSEPRDEIADFEEYTWLYEDAWSDTEVRWLLATVPSAMIFDDHDVRDDWNTSHAWREEMQRRPWWRERIVGAYMAYWLYQHLGNLSPAVAEREGLLARVRDPADGEAALRRFAERADDEHRRGLSQWSYVRDLGPVRLVVVDSRSGRVLEEEDERRILDDEEWRQLEGGLRGDCEHLVVASAVPLLLAPALHDLERWNEAVCAGAWGRRAALLGERLRQGLDLEHWAAFGVSFERMTRRLGDVAAGRHGRAPRAVIVLSGDVHHSYVAPLHVPSRPPASPVVQVVSSPLRNALPRSDRRVLRFAAGAVARSIGRLLARGARLPRPGAEWSLTTGPLFGNGLGQLRLGPDGAELRLQRAVLHGDDARLHELHRERLDAPPL